VSVNHDAYDGFFVRGDAAGDGYEALFSWLDSCGFLTTESAQPVGPIGGGDAAETGDGFFSLRSQRSDQPALGGHAGLQSSLRILLPRRASLREAFQ
jgi:hypothetical protein